MADSPMIRILENDNNRRGDLFGRLMADLFVALGYEQPRLNVHKSGRELDLTANHRLESRRAIAECKATADLIGGDDINKFVGALDVERGDGEHISAYFISLSGFRETAIEQEKQRKRKVILLSGNAVVDELVRGRTLIPKEKATDLAGRLCPNMRHLDLDTNAELLAHERGWIWAVYYMQGKARTHFALIHSDGTPLNRTIADEIIASDLSCGGILSSLICLNPATQSSTDEEEIQSALTAYAQYLANECGMIQLDGLPADSDVGSRSLRLENLFVPLHLDIEVNNEVARRQSVGNALEKRHRLALLAPPGGGKSTLLKRLAVAYTDSTRRQQVDDGLPDKKRLPLFFRCRELRHLARGSFSELVDALAKREPVRQFERIFRTHIDRELVAGNVLLLIDGLDEISDSGDRAAFVSTIRSVLQAYPDNGCVVTSREAGFRHVASHLAPICTRATLSPFDAGDIRRLCVAWHVEVVGDTEKVRADAEKLAESIVKNDRIQRLAVNPLLLTTLLLVKRWVGELPTRRAVLYGKAVELLLMTWNTEGHEPIPQEEALPQLCYVASTMMQHGSQKISRPRLALLLQEARDVLQTELGYVRGTVEEFIHRVEDRSSLLMMSGHDVEDGQLVEFFEFRHLTFQEFLTAKAMVEGWHYGRRDEDTLASVLKPYFDNESWREVIPLAAVMGGKQTEGLITALTETVEATKCPQVGERVGHNCVSVLGNCLADEASARPATIQSALRQLVRHGRILEGEGFTVALIQGRYGRDFANITEATFSDGGHDIGNSGSAFAEVLWRSYVEGSSFPYTRVAELALMMLQSHADIERCKGAILCMRFCFGMHRREKTPDIRSILIKSGDALVPMLYSDDVRMQFTGCWALAWLGECKVWEQPGDPDVLGKLFELSQTSSDNSVRYVAGWAFCTQTLLSRDEGKCLVTVPREVAKAFVEQNWAVPSDIMDIMTLLLAWYLRLRPDDEILKEARLCKQRLPLDDLLDAIIQRLEATEEPPVASTEQGEQHDISGSPAGE